MQVGLVVFYPDAKVAKFPLVQSVSKALEIGQLTVSVADSLR